MLGLKTSHAAFPWSEPRSSEFASNLNLLVHVRKRISRTHKFFPGQTGAAFGAPNAVLPLPTTASNMGAVASGGRILILPSRTALLNTAVPAPVVCFATHGMVIE